jgi:hypothetical protein
VIILSWLVNDIKRKLGRFYHIKMQQENQANIMDIINLKIVVLKKCLSDSRLDLHQSSLLDSQDYETGIVQGSQRNYLQDNERYTGSGLGFVRSYLL